MTAVRLQLFVFVLLLSVAAFFKAPAQATVVTINFTAIITDNGPYNSYPVMPGVSNGDVVTGSLFYTLPPLVSYTTPGVTKYYWQVADAGWHFTVGSLSASGTLGLPGFYPGMEVLDNEPYPGGYADGYLITGCTVTHCGNFAITLEKIFADLLDGGTVTSFDPPTSLDLADFPVKNFAYLILTPGTTTIEHIIVGHITSLDVIVTSEPLTTALFIFGLIALASIRQARQRLVLQKTTRI
ncbi:hypothetical protein [Govanella unica]|uniref:PEP-CTERM protein-sorting domain-containing protein n=1 Tax=Govanella unica TaxID=2975056 RepID=A0A9X3TYX0_9PROT|nr:hypothetical protein [Govania unica]MDA5194353.1 hypothetical protein [Govania unica]